MKANLIGAILGVLALGAWFFVRKRGGAASQIQTDAERTSLSFRCPKCARALKVKAELASKKVKCPRCGNTIVVPQTKLSASRLGHGNA